MTEYQMISIVSLVGFLILALGSLRAHRLDRKRALMMAGAWLAIFGAVSLFIDTIA